MGLALKRVINFPSCLVEEVFSISFANLLFHLVYLNTSKMALSDADVQKQVREPDNSLILVIEPTIQGQSVHLSMNSAS